MQMSTKCYNTYFSNQNLFTVPANCCLSRICTETSNRHIFESLYRVIKSLENPSTRIQLSSFYNCLAIQLSKNDCFMTFPDMIYRIESDEVFIEWIFSDFRLGILFCDNPYESGWDIVVNTPEGVRSSSMFNEDMSSAVSNMFEFISRLA